jgi:hypothetical protein
VSVTEDDQPGPGEASDVLQDLTRRGREAFQDVLDEVRARLCEELRRQRRALVRHDLTSDDVYEASKVVARAMCGSPTAQEEPVIDEKGPAPDQSHRTRSQQGIGTGLIALGSVGVGSMHPYLHSWWQITLLVVFAVLLVAGVVVLAWRDGTRSDDTDR